MSGFSSHEKSISYHPRLLTGHAENTPLLGDNQFSGWAGGWVVGGRNGNLERRNSTKKAGAIPHSTHNAHAVSIGDGVIFRPRWKYGNIEQRRGAKKAENTTPAKEGLFPGLQRRTRRHPKYEKIGPR